MIYLSSRDDRLLYRFDFSHKPVCDYTLSFVSSNHDANLYIRTLDPLKYSITTNFHQQCPFSCAGMVQKQVHLTVCVLALLIVVCD